MEVDFAFLADKAEAVNGKIYVVSGAIDTIWAPRVPAVHPYMSFVMRLLFSSAEVDRTHRVEIHLIDEDGRRMTTVGGDTRVERKPDLPRGWPQSFIAVLNFANLKFERFGDYSFEIVVNNSSMKSVKLRVSQHPQSPS